MVTIVNPERLKSELIAQAHAVGCAVAAIAVPLPPARSDHLPRWLAAGCHAKMRWMEHNPQQRCQPVSLLSEARAVLVIGVYQPPSAPGAIPWAIAEYAARSDYHVTITSRLQQLAAWLGQRLGREFPFRVCVDSAPLLEKPLAATAGIGWQGKNSLLVSRDYGCRLLLGELLLPLELPADSPEADHCGVCTSCLEACPTAALATPYQVDARECLAYWNIEARGAIPLRLRRALGTRLFGCDSCMNACPWNRFAPGGVNEEVVLLGSAWEAFALAELTPEQFKERFRETPVARLGVERWLRNLAVVLGNSPPELAWMPLGRLLEHPSALVRAHAAWGLGQHLAHRPEPLRWLGERLAVEHDETVRVELIAALEVTASRCAGAAAGHP